MTLHHRICMSRTVWHPGTRCFGRGLHLCMGWGHNYNFSRRDFIAFSHSFNLGGM